MQIFRESRRGALPADEKLLQSYLATIRSIVNLGAGFNASLWCFGVTTSLFLFSPPCDKFHQDRYAVYAPGATLALHRFECGCCLSIAVRVHHNSVVLEFHSNQIHPPKQI
jgi:hypothetical protein